MGDARVLDSHALLAHLEDEPGGEKVRRALRRASAGTLKLYLSVINLGEIYSIAFRERGRQRAEEALFLVRQLPVEIVDAGMEITLAASRLKAAHPVAYADCFAAALALQIDAPVLTGDPEFKTFGKDLRVEWI